MAVSRHVRIALQRRVWRGAVGNWAGAGTGSSIDFQDHRPYLPGDDPRYIDWAAYARSGNYIMKLYREEVSPRVDLLIDTSRSMLLDDAKRARALELLYFCVESCLAMGASLLCRRFTAVGHDPIALPELLVGRWVPEGGADAGGLPDMSALPLRSGSLRIVISDLLFDASPESLLRPLAAAGGRVLIFAPFAAMESEPDWNRNVEFVDCESGRVRRQRVQPELMRRYRQAYDRHFAVWRDWARRYDARLARVPAADGLAEALRYEAIPNGVVEAWT